MKTFKRDYVERIARADAISVMRQFGGASQSTMSARISWNESRQERVERGFAVGAVETPNVGVVSASPSGGEIATITSTIKRGSCHP